MPPKPMEGPHFPIVYVRGYAMSRGALERAVADPHMGFNEGSTQTRQAWTGDLRQHLFESPLIRLMKEHGYQDVYSNGRDMPPESPVPERPVLIYRYYDAASDTFGDGDRREIERYAAGLGDLILRARQRVCAEHGLDPATFRVYLVAHSMGGLICRSFLQNPKVDTLSRAGDLGEARAAVDKVFTYATPHNGIDLRVIGNVPGFFSRNNANNFDRDRMRDYLGLGDGSDDRVDSLGGTFDPDRFFCLVGTNHHDYEVAAGWSSRAVGPMSDGLVRIVNATVRGPAPGGGVKHAPRAFVHRSHSGDFGIVNSEDGYQNLERFLFGDVRVDGVLEVKDITLPAAVQERRDAGKEVRASYHFDVTVRVRGVIGAALHRRDVEHKSSILRKYDELVPRKAGAHPRNPHLFSVFLSADPAKRAQKGRSSLGFSIDLAVHVPEYEIDGVLFFDDHFEGGFIYRDKINLEAVPPSGDKTGWRIKYGFDSSTPNRIPRGRYAESRPTDGGLEFRIPIESRGDPGIDAQLVLRARSWS
jgi:hypothetical protein